MRRFSTLALLLLTATALAGCVGGNGEKLVPLFTVTAKDAGKTTFLFDASTSAGDDLTFAWDFGDGTAGQGPTTTHTYQYVNGDYTVKLTIKNSKGVSAAFTQKVATGTQPNADPILCLTANQRLVSTNEEVTFDARASYDDDNEPLKFVWDFNYANPDEARDNYQDLGHQQYGHDPDCSDENMGGGGGGGGDSVPDDLDTPLVPLDNVDRLLERLTPRHGEAPSGPAETYNSNFDGRVASNDALQTVKFPAAATYYVLVKAVDPKSAVGAGYLRIRVEDNAPAAVSTLTHSATLHYGTDVVPPLPGGAANKTDSWRWKMEYPGTIGLTITFTAESQSPEIKGWICLAGKTDTECREAPVVEIPKGGSPRQASHTFTTPSPGSEFRILIENVSPAVNVDVDESLTRVYDTNPWYATEAGEGHDDH